MAHTYQPQINHITAKCKQKTKFNSVVLYFTLCYVYITKKF